DLPLLAVEHALGRLRIRGPRQGSTKRHAGIDELLKALINEQYARFVTLERVAGLFVECCQIAARKRGGGRKRFKRDGGTLELTIDVAAQILGDLQRPAFDLALFEARHAIEGEDGDCEER